MENIGFEEESEYVEQKFVNSGIIFDRIQNICLLTRRIFC